VVLEAHETESERISSLTVFGVGLRSVVGAVVAVKVDTAPEVPGANATVAVVTTVMAIPATTAIAETPRIRTCARGTSRCRPTLGRLAAERPCVLTDRQLSLVGGMIGMNNTSTRTLALRGFILVVDAGWHLHRSAGAGDD
jgi:hypothetical protein